jgi:uncharacterized protein YozE (UPF0346 family)
MTFKEFLLQRRASHDAKGDFVRLALADPNLPDVTDWQELRPYFIDRHSNEGIFDAGEDVWKEFQASERKALRQAR